MKRKREGNIALIGYRGVGKTSVGQRLADQLGWLFIDTDQLIVEQAEVSIAELFEREGEERFRDREALAVALAMGGERTVVSVGGGAVLRAENRLMLSRAAHVVWLTASAAEIAQRLASDSTTSDNRPQLTAVGGLAEIEQLLAVREPLYRKLAQTTIDTTGLTVDDIARQIVAAAGL